MFFKAIRQYRALRSLKNFWEINGNKNFQLDATLPFFIKQGSSPADLKYSYSLTLWEREACRKLRHPFYFDADFAILMNVKSNDQNMVAIACIAFTLNGRNNNVEIVQIQSSSYPERVNLSKEQVTAMLAPIKWERLLVASLCTIAKKSGIKMVFLRPGRKNGWNRGEHNSEVDKRFYIRYDVTAKRSGFKFDRSLDTYRITADSINWPVLENEITKQI